MGGLRAALPFTLSHAKGVIEGRGAPKSWPSHCIVPSMEPKKKIERFEDLIVWQKSMSLAEEIYRVTKQGEFTKDWGVSQGSGREFSNTSPYYVEN